MNVAGSIPAASHTVIDTVKSPEHTDSYQQVCTTRRSMSAGVSECMNKVVSSIPAAVWGLRIGVDNLRKRASHQAAFKTIAGEHVDRYCFQFREQLLCKNVKRFRGGLVFDAHRLCVSLTLGSRAKKRRILYTKGPKCIAASRASNPNTRPIENWSFSSSIRVFRLQHPMFQEIMQVISIRAVRSYPQTFIIHKLGCNQNYYTCTVVSLINTVLCRQFPWTKFINFKCFDMRSVYLRSQRSRSAAPHPPREGDGCPVCYSRTVSGCKGSRSHVEGERCAVST